MRSRHRLEPPPLLPRAFRRRLSARHLADISLLHHVNLDDLVRVGDASIVNYVGSVLTWGFVAERFGLAEAEMDLQLNLADALLQRFAANGHVVLSDDEYALARDGVVLMDLIAAEADMATAAWAAERSAVALRRKVEALTTLDARGILPASA